MREGSAAETVDRLSPAFFDASHEPMVTNKTPAPGGDILSDSANNLYSNVTAADLSGVTEVYGLNSRLVKTDAGLVEEVYRAAAGMVMRSRPSAGISRRRSRLPRPRCERRLKH